ncbi:MAG: lasso peptide [Gemmatimonadota bacterium]|nr:lasso peptide [Gemmatimonadota bacterium]
MKKTGDGSMSKSDKSENKKPYRTPRLTVYGDIREITQAVGKRGQKDGGAKGATMIKT